MKSSYHNLESDFGSEICLNTFSCYNSENYLPLATNIKTEKLSQLATALDLGASFQFRNELAELISFTFSYFSTSSTPTNLMMNHRKLQQHANITM